MALAAVCRAPGRRAHARGDQGTRGKASASHKAESQLAPSRPDRPGLRVTRHGDHRRDKHDDTLRTLRHPHRLRLGDSDGGIGATGPGTGQPTSAHSGGSTGNPGYVPPKSRQEICCSRPGLLSPKITPINTARPAPATPTKRSCFGFNARFSALRREKKFLAQRIDMRNVMQIVLFNIARNRMYFPIYSPYRAERQERCA
jgi:hypothetical protein